MDKKELLKAHLAKPLEKGDMIWIAAESKKKVLAKFDRLDGDDVYYELDKDIKRAKLTEVEIEKDTRSIGADPFKKAFRANQYNVDLWQLLFRVGWQIEDGNYELRHQKMGDHQVPEVNFDSCVTGPKGEDIMYQRGLVWSVDDKKLLIDSIYNNIEIGKFVLRLRKWNWVKERLEKGQFKYTAFADVVDGKQRINTLIEFVTNQFPDCYGNYWRDLSDDAQWKFRNYMKFSYFELDENTTDSEVLEQFLAINFTGAPMSKEHIEYVKSIRSSI